VKLTRKQFLTSRASTPVPFRPKHVRDFSRDELHALERLNLSGSPGSPKGLSSPMTPSKMSTEQCASTKAQKVDLEMLERKAEEQSNGVNGHH
jgi:hypothetical protein